MKLIAILLVDCIYCLLDCNNLKEYNLTGIFHQDLLINLSTKYLGKTSQQVLNLQLNLCKPLEIQKITPQDQCESGSFGCLQTLNVKNNDTRIINVEKIVFKIKTMSPLSLEAKASDYSFNLNFKCFKTFGFSVEQNNVNFDLSWTRVCTEQGAGSIASFFKLVFIITFCYFFIGVFINVAFYQVKTFPQVLPNHEFWVSITESVFIKVTGRGYLAI